jgi:hypothetical protein
MTGIRNKVGTTRFWDHGAMPKRTPTVAAVATTEAA